LLISAGADDTSHLEDQMESSTIEVHRMYLPAVELFMACQTQWRTGMVGVTGLDYMAVGLVAKTLGIKLSKKVFLWLQVMEGEALKQFSSKQA